MATKKRPKRHREPKLAPVPVVLAGYDMDDQAIEEVIETGFRILERMMTSKNVIRAIDLYAEAQKRASF